MEEGEKQKIKLNIEKKYNEEDVNKLSDELDSEYGVFCFIKKSEVRAKIKLFNCQKDKVIE